MTKFLDGPAADQILALRRAPLLLRVVQNPKGEWDALDQLGDTPGDKEKIFVYVLTEKAGYMHICVRGKGRKGGGYYAVANYRYVPDAHPNCLRDTEAWRAWCRENHHLFRLPEQETT